ncbi:MAG: DUF5677 domain-containing protein [Sarcina sp.]
MNSVESLQITFESIIKKIHSNEIKYNSNDIKGIMALGYFSKIIESGKAIIMLLEKGNLQSAIMPILRSMLEAIIDLDNIANIDGYTDYLEYLNVSNQLFLGKKEYLKNLSYKSNFNYAETKLKYEKLEDKLKKNLKEQYGNKYFNKKNKIETSIKFKFKISKSMDTYDTLYWILCNDTHNNMSSIEEYYIEKVNQNLIVQPFNQMSEDNKKDISETVESILKDSIDRIEKILKL